MPPPLRIQPRIVLSCFEQHLFEQLRACVTDQPIQVRIAGGWVRDKILGRESHDIDVVVDTMSAVDFVHHFQRHARKCGEHGAAGLGILRANPAQSKQVETVMFQYRKHSIDVCQLRSTDNTLSSALEFDARRRDFTINALYYNVQTQSVEDPTGCGLEDLHTRILRTPSTSPVQTLLDDPLRVIRAARFASQVQCEWSSDLSESLKDTRLHDAFRTRVNRERVGQEIQKLFADPATAVEGWAMLHHNNWTATVVAPVALTQQTRSLKHMQALQRWHQQQQSELSESTEPLAMLMAAYLYDSVASSPTAGSDLNRLLRRAFRAWSNRVLDTIELVIHSVHELRESASHPDTYLSSFRVLCRCGSRALWVLALLEIVAGKSTSVCTYLRWLQERSNWLHPGMYVWDLEPVLSGEQIQRALQLPAGPQIADCLRRVHEWQVLQMHAGRFVVTGAEALESLIGA